jgi:hypothetical protein
MKHGEWYDGHGRKSLSYPDDLYQVVTPAPTAWSASHAERVVDEILVRGSWSDPWWLYSPSKGWAIARRWKSKQVELWEGNFIPEMDEIVIEPVNMEEYLLKGEVK